MVLSVIMTWPLLPRAVGAVVGRPGDNMQYVWQIGWFHQALFEETRWPFFTPYLNYPEGWHLARSETTPIQVLLALPFRAIGGDVFGYNAIILLGFAGSGFLTYLWTRRYVDGPLPAVLAGVLFAFAPFRIAHFRAGHLNILGTMWFPLYLWGLSQILVSGRRGWRPAMLAGASLGLIGLTSQYYLFITVVLTLLAGAAFTLIWARSNLADQQFWKTVGLAILIAVPLLLAGIHPYLLLSAQASLPNRSVHAVAGGSAGLTDFVLPATDHFLWGGWVGENFSRNQWVEGSLYLGAVATVLAGAGVALREKVIDSIASKRTWFLVAVGLVGLILALGTHLHWNESMVRIDIPGPLQEILDRESAPIPMPGYFLFKYFPFYAKMRTFKRAAVIPILCVSALAGLGFSRISERLSPPKRIWLVTLVLVLAFMDIYPGPFPEFARIEPRAVDLWLKEQPGSGAVVEFPFYLQEEQLHVYYSLIHDKPIVGGFFNAYPPPQYKEMKPALETFPSENASQLLQEMGVEYILITIDLYQDPVSLLEALPSIHLFPCGQFEDVVRICTSASTRDDDS